MVACLLVLGGLMLLDRRGTRPAPAPATTVATASATEVAAPAAAPAPADPPPAKSAEPAPVPDPPRPTPPAPVVDFRPDPAAESCPAPAGACARQNYGTRVEFVDDPALAAREALKDKKLLLVLHVAGNFENDAFT
jgi:hypothetical protein